MEGYEVINSFLVTPNIKDIVVYILFGICWLIQYFITKKIKNSNLNTSLFVDNKVKELKEVESKHKINSRLIETIDELKEENKQIKKEVEKLTKMLTIFANGSNEHIRNGTSEEINNINKGE